MNKRKKVIFGFFLFFITGNMLYAQSVVSLDEAIQEGAAEIQDKLEQGVKVAVLNFISPTQRFSDYVLDEMMTIFVRYGKITVVDRANLELIQQEMNFQMSGEVSDDSARAIGRLLGAQSIVSGSIEDLDTHYRIRFRAIDVESAAIQALVSINVRKDSQIATLMEQRSSPLGRAGANFGYGALNIVFGLGSYLQGDVGGGIIVTSGYALSLGLIIWELVGLKYEDALAGIPGTIGLGIAGGTLVFGFVRPFIYNRTPRLAMFMDNFDIVAVSNEQSSNSLRITYTHRF